MKFKIISLAGRETLLAFFMFQAFSARFLQSADKFCMIFPCKMFEFSMFYEKFGCMHKFILHVLSARLTKVSFHTHPGWKNMAAMP